MFTSWCAQYSNLTSDAWLQGAKSSVAAVSKPSATQKKVESSDSSDSDSSSDEDIKNVSNPCFWILILTFLVVSLYVSLARFYFYDWRKICLKKCLAAWRKLIVLVCLEKCGKACFNSEGSKGYRKEFQVRGWFWWDWFWGCK